MPIKNNIAMTGEIETNGLVTAIGGLESKLQGAKKAGVELVFIPFENKSDFDKIIKKKNKLKS
jgi:ATP-dependent Lon protease